MEQEQSLDDAYEAPQVVELGTIEEITQGVEGSKPDGGFFFTSAPIL